MPTEPTLGLCPEGVHLSRLACCYALAQRSLNALAGSLSASLAGGYYHVPTLVAHENAPGGQVPYLRRRGSLGRLRDRDLRYRLRLRLRLWLRLRLRLRLWLWPRDLFSRLRPLPRLRLRWGLLRDLLRLRSRSRLRPLLPLLLPLLLLLLLPLSRSRPRLLSLPLPLDLDLDLDLEREREPRLRLRPWL